MRTKKLNQKDLQHLYTGAEIRPFLLYSQVTFTMWIAMSFSSGMPIMYPIACVTLFTFYWLQKILILNYHSKTPQFVYDLPNLAVRFLYFGILLHIINAAFVFKDFIPIQILGGMIGDEEFPNSVIVFLLYVACFSSVILVFALLYALFKLILSIKNCCCPQPTR